MLLLIVPVCAIFHPGALFCYNNAVSATLGMMSRSPGAPVTTLDASLLSFMSVAPTFVHFMHY